MEEKKNRSPEEQEAAFKSWLQNKTLRDTTFAYLEKLDPIHAREEENLKQVAVALRAAERVLGDSDGGGGGDDYGDPEAAPKKKSNDTPQKTLKSAWASWTMKHHTFSNVSMSEDFVNKLTGGTRELLKAVDESDLKKGYMTESLKYNFPEIPKKKGLQPRPMTPDQKLLNTIFMREVRRVWKAAAEELESQVDAAKANGGRVVMPHFVESSGGVDLGFGLDKEEADAKAEDKAGPGAGAGQQGYKEDAKSGPASAAAPPKDDALNKPGAGAAPDEGNLTSKILTAISVRRLREWLEEDEDREAEARLVAQREKRQEAKKGHEHFVLRQQDRDEERRRQERRHKRDAEQATQDRLAAAKAKSKDSFERWVVQKEMREQATRCLQLLDPPTLEDHELDLTDTPTHAHVLSTGRALKKIDRTLLPDWAKWADQVLPFNTAVVLWDCFEPRACDVHCSAHSHIKDTLLKLLTQAQAQAQGQGQAGVTRDVGALFKAHATRLLRRQEQEQGGTNAGNKASLLTRKQLAALLAELGVRLKATELRLLMDAFDVNGEGKVDVGGLQEFLSSASGDKGNNKGDALGSKCCWHSTCPRTGMASAYSRSEPTAKQRRAAMLAASGGYGAANAASSRAESKDTDMDGPAERGGGGVEEKGDYDDDDFEAAAGSGAAGAGSAGGGGGRTRTIKLASGETRIVVELADRIARDKLLVRYGVLAPPKATKDGEEDWERPPARCQFCQWTVAQRKAGLDFLLHAAQPAREEEVLKKMLSEGKPPRPPALSMRLPPVTNDGDDEGYSTLILEWEPCAGDLVSFFCLETSGPTGSAKQQPYAELCRDPPSADPSEQLACCFAVRNLQPGTSYQFRIRGFNGFGPGEYAYKIFTTRSTAPPAPRAVRLSNDSVTLRWAFSPAFFKRLSELQALFRAIDSDGSGQVSRGELAAALDAHSDSSAALRGFLLKKAELIGVDISRGCGALFDAIEGDDDGALSWPEFETFFLSAGWADSSKSMAVGASQLRASGGAGAGAGVSAGAGLSYIVEQCTSEFDAKWTVALSTSASHGTISRLRPGASYRFRVRSVNKDGVAGPCSDDAIVHTMLETPAAPTVPSAVPVPAQSATDSAIGGAYIKARAITLAWRRRGDGFSMRDPVTVSRLLADWAGNHDEAEGGVSIEMAFAKYDRNRSGDIDAAELALMLEDLGVETSEERLAEAFSVLDTNGDGIITFDEFAAWWRRDEVSYILKRSEAVVPTSSYVGLSNSHDQDAHKMAGLLRRSSAAASSHSLLSSAGAGAAPDAAAAGGGAGGGEATPVVVYRGESTRYEVLGLEPNRLYHFRLRLAGSRCNSLISAPTLLMTAPLPPSQPLLIDVGSTTARVKWYSPPGGAYKFLVQLRQANKAGVILTPGGLIGSSDPAPGASKGWVPVFNGQETLWTSTTMVPGTEYEVRVVGVNYQGTMGEPSPACRFSTLPRGTGSGTGTGAAGGGQRDSYYSDTSFSIECSGDICTGDTILITERLFVKGDGQGGGKDDTHGASKATHNRSVTSITKSRGVGMGGKPAVAVRMDLSVTSIHSHTLSEGGALPPGAYIGERTIAAHVVKDNYRTCRDAVAAKGLTPKEYKRFGKHRHLWLEVIWQRASNDACKPYELRTGEVIERAQARLEEFEVFRCAWGREDQRASLAVEWASLTDCFLAAPCKPL